MTGLDPAGWSWGRLGAVSLVWTLTVALSAAVLIARVISHAKQTDASGGDFIVRLPYGTRHLAYAIVLAFLPPLLALLRKLSTG